MWEFVVDKPDVDAVAAAKSSVLLELPTTAAAVVAVTLQILCGVGGGAGQALMLLLLLMFENDGLRSDVCCLNPLTGCNGYYRPAIRTQSRCSLLYQIPKNKRINNRINYFIKKQIQT